MEGWTRTKWSGSKNWRASLFTLGLVKHDPSACFSWWRHSFSYATFIIKKKKNLESKKASHTKTIQTQSLPFFSAIHLDLLMVCCVLETLTPRRKTHASLRQGSLSFINKCLLTPTTWKLTRKQTHFWKGEFQPPTYSWNQGPLIAKMGVPILTGRPEDACIT